MSFILNRVSSVIPIGGVATLTGNSGGVVSPTVGNINVVGTGDITVTGNPGTSTLTISGSAAIADTYTTDSGSAVPALNVLQVRGGTGISTSGAGNTITITTTGVTNLTYTGVNHAASPYTVLTADDYISCDVTAGVITVLLPNAPATGKVWTIKDKVGLAASSNITITTVGGAVTIDGATSFVMNTAYEAVNVIFNGVSYEIY
jgi:trimeric autotransporter adhesin